MGEEGEESDVERHRSPSSTCYYTCTRAVVCLQAQCTRATGLNGECCKHLLPSYRCNNITDIIVYVSHHRVTKSGVYHLTGDAVVSYCLD